MANKGTREARFQGSSVILVSAARDKFAFDKFDDRDSDEVGDNKRRRRFIRRRGRGKFVGKVSEVALDPSADSDLEARWR